MCYSCPDYNSSALRYRNSLPGYFSTVKIHLKVNFRFRGLPLKFRGLHFLLRRGAPSDLAPSTFYCAAAIPQFPPSTTHKHLFRSTTQQLINLSNSTTTAATMPKQQAKRARPARHSGGSVIAQSKTKTEFDIDPKTTTSCTPPIRSKRTDADANHQ